ncbi:MAG: hypothetical protein RIB71_20310 [Imperialibacter sp.]|uniref:hypothetical protein n=1 Tax=Imperialibacter sp. TaxID=2038411 RepID=UPI0032EF940E
MDGPEEEERYEVIITSPVELAFYEVLEYLFDNYTFDRAEQVAHSLRNLAKSLSLLPKRGTIESRLSHRANQYRFILFRRSPRADIKVIYYIEERERKVYVTDFFPTENDDSQIG